MTHLGLAALESTESELVERHRYGDPEAFEVVYQRFERLVFNLALRLSGDPEEAADLVQEVFLRVYKNLGGFRGRSTLKTWIFRVAVNCCRSRLGRKRWSRARRDPAESLEELPDPGRGPEDRALVRGLRASLEEALAEIPLPFREAVILRDLQGLSYREISGVLGVRIGTVRSRIARGRERLRRRLETSEWRVTPP